MGWFARTVLWGCFFGSACGLCAFDLQYGSLFSVAGITIKDGKPVLPLSREKYANVRVLDKETFDFLKNCTASCKQPGGEGEVQIVAFRAAKTRAGMWIADVSIDEKWLLTFLLFQTEEKVDVVFPQEVNILNKDWFDKVLILLRGQIVSEEKEN